MSSRTSVQLDKETKTLLDRIKQDMGARSYAEVIMSLARNAKKLEKSDRGSLPKLETFQREKHDRFD